MGRLISKKNIDLLLSLVYFDIRAKYHDSLLGLWWALLQPILLISTYALVFGFIFKGRHNENIPFIDYIVLLFSGLIIYLFFSEVLSKSTQIFRQQPQFIKKIVFPLELLPIVSICSVFINLVINISLLFVLISFSSFELNAEIILIIFLIIPLIIILMGFSLIISSIGVFFQDIIPLVYFINSLLLFLSPIFYPLNSLPIFLQKILYLNPLTFPIDAFRSIISSESIQPAYYFALYYFEAIIIFLISYIFFIRTKKFFSEYL